MPVGWIKVSTIALVVLVLQGATALSAAGLDLLKSKMASAPQVSCNASIGEFSCSFTNISLGAVQGSCLFGGLKPKGNGKPLQTTPLCSGTLGPRETKVVAVRLIGQDVVSACHDSSGTLDFSTCDLEIKPLD